MPRNLEGGNLPLAEIDYIRLIISVPDFMRGIDTSRRLGSKTKDLWGHVYGRWPSDEALEKYAGHRGMAVENGGGQPPLSKGGANKAFRVSS